MKKLILLPFIVLFTMANQCDTNHIVSGVVQVDVPQLEVQFAQRNGINYIRTIQNNLIMACMSIDPSTLYDSTFSSIEAQDAFRATPMAAEEISNCS